MSQTRVDLHKNECAGEIHFRYEYVYTKTRFDMEVKGNLETVDSNAVN